MFNFISKAYNGMLYKLITKNYKKYHFIDAVAKQQQKEHEQSVNCFSDHFGKGKADKDFCPETLIFEIKEKCPEILEAWTLEELTKYEQAVLEKAFLKIKDGRIIPSSSLNDYLKIHGKPVSRKDN